MAAVRLSPTYVAIRAYSRGRLIRARLARDVAWRGVRILGYHQIADAHNDLAVRPERFREQLERVMDLGVEPVPLTAVPGMLESPVEGRYLCVTFDDGYRDNLEAAVPVLEELGIPATIFVPTEVIEGRAGYTWFEDPPAALSWEEIDGLVQAGLVDVQSHTRTHVRLPHVDDDRAWEEIAGSKRDLEQRVPYEVTSLCYPAGLHGPRDVAYTRDAGYRLGLATSPGVNEHGQDPFRLNRTLLYWSDRMGDFLAKMGGCVDRPPRLRAALYRKLARDRSTAPPQP